MDNRRQQKVGSLIQEAFSEILLRDLKGWFGKAFVTVTNVKVTSDLSIARFYLSIFNVEDKEAVLHMFKARNHELRKMLGEKLRFNLRKIPEIEFYIDDTLDYVYKMEDLFKQIKKDDNTTS
jgi:ribosome-binding factor A